MSQYDEILGQVPLSQLAGQLGVDESEARQAAEQALPALLGGLQANATDPAGASSIMHALSQHQGGVPNDLEQVDVADGRVTLAGRPLAVDPVAEVPLSRRYLLR